MFTEHIVYFNGMFYIRRMDIHNGRVIRTVGIRQAGTVADGQFTARQYRR